MNYTLKNIPELLANYLGPDKIIKESHTSILSGVGAASITLKLDVIVENKKNDSKEIINGVVKVIKNLEYSKNLFDMESACTNEMGFYTVIVPTVEKFQKELGQLGFADLFAKCFGARKNLTGDDKIGDDAALVLDNLKVFGYESIPRSDGFTLEAAKLILKDMAQFHAVPLALKIKNPDLFEKNIKVFCKDFDPKNLGMDELVRDLVKRIDEVAHWAPKIRHWGQIDRCQPREPFATLIHTDMHSDNTMQIFKEGQPVSNKFIDFQLITYGSPAADVFFFIWSSVKMDVIQSHLDYLLNFYHEHFIEILKKHQVDPAPFSYDNFVKELELESEYEFGHAAIFYSWFATRRTENLGENFSPSQFCKFVVDNASSELINKLRYMVNECVRRKWLK